MRTIQIAALAGAVLLLSACGAPNPAEPGEPEAGGHFLPAGITEEDVAAAQEEGQVAYYTASQEKDEQAITSVFEKEYGIEVIIQRQSSGPTYELIRAEADAGQDLFDVVTVCNVALSNQMGVDGVLANLDDLGLHPDADTWLPGSQDENRFWAYSTVLLPGTIFWNNKLVSEADAPKTWEDLLDPKWAGGKIASNTAESGGSSIETFYSVWKAYGPEYWDDLAAQGLVFYSAGQQTVQAVQTGERPVGIVADTAVGFSDPNISMVSPEPVLLAGCPQSVSAEPQHAAAAKLFHAWYTSTEGQKTVGEVRGAYSARGDVPVPAGRPDVSTLELLETGGETADPVFIQNLIDEWITVFQPR